jgi:uncharacterized protein (TIGR00266 family)
MMAMSTGVTLAAKAEGGIMKSLKRAALGGESFFVSTYTAPPSGGFVDVAARLPGDISTQDIVQGRALFISKGSWLANDVTVNLDTKWGGFKNMFGSEGGFIVRADGRGTVVFGCYGALEVWNLEAGQGITVDTGHMVAYEDTVRVSELKIRPDRFERVRQEVQLADGQILEIAEFFHPRIVQACVRQAFLKRLRAELRVMSGAGNRPHIDELLHAVVFEQRYELLDRVCGVTDGEHCRGLHPAPERLRAVGCDRGTPRTQGVPRSADQRLAPLRGLRKTSGSRFSRLAARFSLIDS